MTFSLERNRIDKISREAMTDELKRVAKHYRYKYFAKRQFDDVAKTCKSTAVINEFGSWPKALLAIGIELKPSRKPRKDQIPEHELFAELERVWRLLGHRPSKDEWEGSKPRFSYTTYKTRFGGWINACVRFIEHKSVGSILDPTHNPCIDPPMSIPIPKPRHIPEKLRNRVWTRDNFKCVQCGQSPATHPIKLHIDHKIPFSDKSGKGKTTFENLQTLCSNCNWRKGTKGSSSLA